jgi:hypothetical protein
MVVEMKKTFLCMVVWFAALWLYGLAGESDRQSASDLTADVDRAAVLEGRQ